MNDRRTMNGSRLKYPCLTCGHKSQVHFNRGCPVRSSKNRATHCQIVGCVCTAYKRKHEESKETKEDSGIPRNSSSKPQRSMA